MKNKSVELLAPANKNTYTTAVQAGADAIYLGASDFGARQYADNFSNEELKGVLDYCHLRGVRVHLTMNTLVSDRELEAFAKIAVVAVREGVDAFIVQDLGAADILRQIAPQVPLHASTQMTLHNLEGVRLAKQLGFSRVVLSRELCREEIAEICDQGGVETEIFIHGALCMGYSGQCLMSSLIGGRSGNRGKCAQPCRLPYALVNASQTAAKGYLLSPKDLSLADCFPAVLALGIDSLKIEGRMKGPDYVAACVSVFRRLIDQERCANMEEKRLLENAFSRGGFTKGHFLKQPTKRMMQLENGNDDIYKKQDQELLEPLRKFTAESCNIRKRPVSLTVRAEIGKPLRASLQMGRITVQTEGVIVQEAQKKATDAATIERQLSKTGETPFWFDRIEVVSDASAFLPLSGINDLRRSLFTELERQLLQSYKRAEKPYKIEKTQPKISDKFWTAEVADKGQGRALLREPLTRLYLPVEIAFDFLDKPNVVPVFPDIVKEECFAYYDGLLKKLSDCGVTRCKTGNLGILRRALSLGFTVWGGSALNIFNSVTASRYAALGVRGAQISGEMHLQGIPEVLCSPLEASVLVYGRQKMMQTANCPLRHAGRCGKAEEFLLLDRKQEHFPFQCDSQNCVLTILNAKPLYMADKLQDLEAAGITGFDFFFTSETPQECRAILESYRSREPAKTPFTRGHFYRGV